MTFEGINKQAFSLTEKESAKIAGQIVKDYQTSLKLLNARLKKVYDQYLDGIPPGEYYNVMTKYERLTKLIKELQTEYLATAKLVGEETKRAAELSISNSYYRNMYAINWPIDGPGLFTPLNTKIIEISVYGTPKVWQELTAQARARLTDEFGDPTNYLPQSGTLIDELVTKRRGEVLAGIESAVRQSLITGDGYRKTARKIRGIMETDANKALRIVRTESHRNVMAGNYAMTQNARANGVDVRRMIVSTLDVRTREQSAIVDGRLEDDKGYFTYPGGVKVAIPGNSGNPSWDINDRESVINTIGGEVPQLRRGRNPVTGETDIISWTSFDDWMKDNNLTYKKGKMVYNV
jgi:hypothetical protein